QPWNPDAVADLVSPRVRSAIDDAPDDLMAGNYRKLWIRQIAIHNVKIRPAHGASTNPDEYFTRFQFGLRQVRFLEYILRLEQDVTAHRQMFDRSARGDRRPSTKASTADHFERLRVFGAPLADKHPALR